MTATMTAATVEALWVEHHSEVVRYLQRQCSDTDLAADLASETFLAASKSLETGCSITVGWLMVVAKRRLMDHWRSAYRQQAALRVLENERVDYTIYDPAASTGGQVEIGLDLLCPSQRHALTLRYLDDCSVEQVADTLGLTYRAAESLLARGRRTLGRRLQEQAEAVETAPKDNWSAPKPELG